MANAATTFDVLNGGEGGVLRIMLELRVVGPSGYEYVQRFGVTSLNTAGLL